MQVFFLCSLLIATLYMFRASLAHCQELRNCVCNLWYWHVILCNDGSTIISAYANRKSKINLMNDDNNTDNHTHFMEQAFNKPYPSMERKYTTMKEIEQIIKSLKTKNSYRYKEISTKILKISSPFISSPLSYICNKIFFGMYYQMY